MALPVRLQDVVEVMELPNDEWKSYINRVTGEIVLVTDEDARLVEDENSADGELPAWHAEHLAKVREALDSDSFLCLPGRFEIHEWALMERFAFTQGEAVRDVLLDAIHGSGAFRHFKSSVRRLGIDQAWYRFRDAAVEQVAREWLDAEGIPYEPGKRSGRSA